MMMHKYGAKNKNAIHNFIVVGNVLADPRNSPTGRQGSAQHPFNTAVL
jgi:hypothetical protein